MDTTTSIKLLGQLPSNVEKKLCECLEDDDSWKKVVQTLIRVRINLIPITELEQEKSPAQKLVKILHDHNFSIFDTYKVLAVADLKNVMDCLTEYVDAASRQEIEDGRKRLHESHSSISYIYELPEDIRKQLCTVLDADESWELLLARFEDAGFQYCNISQYKLLCPTSPSSELVRQLADRNFKISLLYIALASIKQLRAMTFLESYVSETVRNKVASHRDMGGVQDNSKKLNNVSASTNRDVHTTKSSTILKEGCTSYSQLENATEGWSKCIKGNFFLGTIDGTDVAIKRLRLKNKDLNFQLRVLEQLRDLNSADHANILKMDKFVEGYCDPCLIYPYKRNKSLYDILKSGITSSRPSSSSTLTWEKKRHIALGAGNALSYLHKHFKRAVAFKSSDILLDDNLEPKVADPCLPCFIDQASTKGLLSFYLPMQDVKPSGDLDCFCLGTIILELLLGKPADAFPEHPSKWICSTNDVKKKLRKIVEEAWSKNQAESPSNKALWRCAVQLCYQPDNKEKLGIESVTHGISTLQLCE